MTYCHYDKATKCIKVRFAKEFFEYFYELVKKVDEKTSHCHHITYLRVLNEKISDLSTVIDIQEPDEKKNKRYFINTST